jgi:hypothetical protein
VRFTVNSLFYAYLEVGSAPPRLTFDANLNGKQRHTTYRVFNVRRRYSILSRAGTIRIGVTRRSATCRQESSNAEWSTRLMLNDYLSTESSQLQSVTMRRAPLPARSVRAVPHGSLIRY